MTDLLKKEEETRFYFVIRRFTQIENYGAEDEEILKSSVQLSGVFDHEHAMQRIEKDFDFDTWRKHKDEIKILHKDANGYKILHVWPGGYAWLITEYFDYTWLNRCIMQPVFESACEHY